MKLQIDPISISKRYAPTSLQLPLLNFLLYMGIPFSRGTGVSVDEIGDGFVRVKSRQKRARENHVRGAHACLLAMIGEMPAGLVVAQQFPFKDYRLIISELKIQYHKQGKGTLYSTAKAPKTWPEPDEKKAIWIDVESEIKNQGGELVATTQTRWQAKAWTDVRFVQ